MLLSLPGAKVEKNGGGATEFKYPSYVQHIMGCGTNTSPTTCTHTCMHTYTHSHIFYSHLWPKSLMSFSFMYAVISSLWVSGRSAGCVPQETPLIWHRLMTLPLLCLKRSVPQWPSEFGSSTTTTFAGSVRLGNTTWCGQLTVQCSVHTNTNSECFGAPVVMFTALYTVSKVMK